MPSASEPFKILKIGRILFLHTLNVMVQSAINTLENQVLRLPHYDGVNGSVYYGNCNLLIYAKQSLYFLLRHFRPLRAIIRLLKFLVPFYIRIYHFFDLGGFRTCDTGK